MSDMKITALAPWYGSNRMLGSFVGKALAGCSWVGIPFAGGMAEVPHIKASTLVVNDLHRHCINLAQVCADPVLGPKLYRRLRREAFSQESLEAAQVVCDGIQAQFIDENVPIIGDDGLALEWAHAYFVACWMNRSAKAGTDDEFKGKLPVRWSASGGDSALRFHNAVLGLPAWRRTLRRCNFTCMDFREFLDKCKDEATSGIYSDSPFPEGKGDEYRHKFSERDHVELAAALTRFRNARVVCRFYDCGIIHRMYPADAGWKVTFIPGGRTQANNEAPEVLITNFDWTP